MIGTATIDSNFQITNIDEALFFSWIIDKWFLKNTKGNENQFTWQTLDENSNRLLWVLKKSTGESYIDRRFNPPYKSETCQDIILAEASGSTLNVFIKAESGNTIFLAQEFYNRKLLINECIKEGNLNNIKVPVKFKDYFFERNVNLRQVLWNFFMS